MSNAVLEMANLGRVYGTGHSALTVLDNAAATKPTPPLSVKHVMAN